MEEGWRMSEPGELLTTPEVAELLGLSVRRVKRLIQAGRLRPTRKIGNSNVFRRDLVEAFAAIPRPPGRPAKRHEASTPEGAGDGRGS